MIRKPAVAALAVMGLALCLNVMAQTNNTLTIPLGRVSCSVGTPTCQWPGTGVEIIVSSRQLVTSGIPNVDNGRYTILGMTLTFGDGSSAVGRVNLITASNPATLTIPSTGLGQTGDSVVGQVLFNDHSCGRYGCAAITSGSDSSVTFTLAQ